MESLPERSEAAPAGSRRLLVARSWVVFFACFCASHAAVQWAGQDFRDLANELTAQLTALVLWLAGAGGRAEGTVVSSSLYSVEIIFECTAIFPIALFASAVVAYPTDLRAKLLGIAAGLPLLVSANLLRLSGLCLVGYLAPGTFEAAHLIVGQALMIFVTVMIWVVWALRQPGVARAVPA